MELECMIEGKKNHEHDLRPKNQVECVKKSRHPRVISSPQPVMARNLPIHFKVLYGLNGAILALPSLASTSLINDYIHIPIAYLSAYYAVSFLPYSLKPVYSMVTVWIERGIIRIQRYVGHLQPETYVSNVVHHFVLGTLMIFLGTAISCMGFLSKGDIVVVFFLSFSIGVLMSWSDFLLGLILIQMAQQYENCSITDDDEENMLSSLLQSENITNTEGNGSDNNINLEDDSYTSRVNSNEAVSMLSLFQTQAVTSRNIGSFLANIIAFFAFLYQYLKNSTSSGNDTHADSTDVDQSSAMKLDRLTIICFFAVTGSLSWVGFFIVKYFQVGIVTHPNIMTSTSETSSVSTSSSSTSNDDITTSSSLLSNSNSGSSAIFDTLDIVLIIIVQVTLILLVLRNALVKSYASFIVWVVVLVALSSLLIVIVVLLRKQSTCHETKDSADVDHRNRVRAVGLFLILRHTIPSPNVLISSFIYLCFGLSPVLLQLFYVFQLLVTTLASWVYQRFIASRFTKRNDLVHIIILFTILNSFCIMIYIPIYHLWKNNNALNVSSSSFTVVSTLFLFVNVVQSFLEELSFLPSIILATTSCIKEDTTNNRISCVSNHNDKKRRNSIDKVHGAMKDRDTSSRSGFQYAVLVSCIDFGDQISAWISIPLVNVFGVKSENGWHHFDLFLFVCAILGLCSLIFLRLISVRASI